MNVTLVVIDAHKFTYARYINRCLDVRVRAEPAMTPEEVEGFRVKPELCVDRTLPPEPVSA